MDDKIRKNIAGYDFTFEEYCEKTKIIEDIEMEEMREFASHIPTRGKIIDIACGPGRDAKIFAEMGFNVLGIDLSKNMLKKAKKMCPNAKFMLCDFTEMKFEPDSFDGTWFKAGLLCVEKRHSKKVLEKIYRMLKGRGIFYIAVKEGQGEGFEFDKRYGLDRYYAYYTKDEIAKLLKDAGFKIFKIFTPKLKSKYHQHQWMDFFAIKENIL